MSAVKHWVAARVTSVALIPLTLWMVYAGISMVGASHEVAAGFFAHPVNAMAAVLLAAIGLYHSVLGIAEIIGDYVPTPGLRALLLWVARLGCIAGLLAVLYAVFSLMSGA